MATIAVFGNSPGAPAPIRVATWDQGFAALGANRTSGDGADPTTYDDPAGVITDVQAQGVVGGEWMVSVG